LINALVFSVLLKLEYSLASEIPPDFHASALLHNLWIAKLPDKHVMRQCLSFDFGYFFSYFCPATTTAIVFPSNHASLLNGPARPGTGNLKCEV